MPQSTDKPAAVSADAREILRARFGHSEFREGQEAVVRSALAGRNLLVVMPTGSGKSLLYQLPALIEEGITLVVSPLIALMKDQVDELTRKGIPATFINSSLDIEEQRARIAACARGEMRLLYVAPERFRAGNFLNLLSRVRIARMAVDEAHCISQWGHDFRPDYRRLKDFRAHMGNPRVTALTATATPRVQRDIIDALGLAPAEVEVHVHGFDRPNLALSVVHARDDDRKFEFLSRFIAGEPGAGIIYTGTRRATEDLTESLRQYDKRVVAYHAGLDPEARARAQETFLSGQARIAVATIAFGMGIDKPDIRFVVHYHLPGSVEQYYQEIGRAGRDGKPSRCVLLHSAGDRALREFFIDLSYPPPEAVQAVYEALWAIPENPVMLTYAELAKECGGEWKDGQVGSAVRLLDGAGLTRQQSSDAPATVGIREPGVAILPRVRGRVQRRVFEALSSAADLGQPGVYSVSLDQLTEAAGLTEEQVRRALVALQAEGHIEYSSPFRGRGIEKLVVDPPPFEQAPIDWKRQRFLRRLEEEKLEAMEEFIRQRGCRRGFILRYFGEDSSLQCGMCDCCKAGGDRQPEARRVEGILAKRPDIALPVLVAVRNLRFPVGTGLIALLVLGSQDKRLLKWRCDRNPAYGRVIAKKETIRDVIAALVQEGYLSFDGEGSRPVLVLTQQGTEAADAADLDAIPASSVSSPSGAASPPPAERAAPAPSPAQKKADLQDDAAIIRAALECIAGIRPAVGIGKVTEVLTGSKAEWIARLGADRLPAYNAIRAKRERVREVIQKMVRQGLLEQDLHAAYPVLTITDEGRAALAGESARARARTPAPQETPSSPDAPAAPLAPASEEPVAPPDQPLSDEPAGLDPARQLDAMLAELMTAGRERALALVEQVRLFHPREVAARLAAHYDAAPDARLRSRVAWVAGELCGEDGLPFLLRCAQSEDPNVRRLAASALGKIGARLRADGAARAARAAEVRQELLLLTRDAAIQVREYAEKAVENWGA